MANKVDIPVVINGKVYTLSGYEGEDYLQNVATYINGKISECKTSDQYRRMNTEYQGILLALNIADDYFKAKKLGDSLSEEIESKDLSKYFIEFGKYLNNCEYADCEHEKEENCGIKKAIQEKKIDIRKI